MNLFYLTAPTNVATNSPTDESTLAGLFIILFIIVLGGGGVILYFIGTNALKFFKKYQDTTSSQIQDFTTFFERSNLSQERINMSQDMIATSLSKVQGSLDKHSERIYDVNSRVSSMGNTMEQYQETNSEKLSDIRRQVEEIDEKFGMLTRDVDHIRRQMDNIATPQLTVTKGGADTWQRNQLRNG